MVWRGMGWETVEEGGWPALGVGVGVEMDFPLMEGEERAEGGGFLGKPRDESPRDRRVESGKDVETGHAGGRERQEWKTDHTAARGTRLGSRKTEPEGP